MSPAARTEYERFPKTWEVLPFLEAIDDKTGGNKKTKKTDYSEAGSLPIVDQGEKEIAGFTDDASLRCKEDLPCILFGDHTRLFKYVEHPFALGADGVKVLVPTDGFDKRFLFHYLRQLKLPNAGYSRHFKFLKETYVPKPPLEIQRRIAAILDQADAIRRKRQQAIDLADEFLRSVFLEMFGDPSATSGEWRRAEISQFLDEGVILEVQDGNHGEKHPKVADFSDTGIPFVTANVISQGTVEIDNAYFLDHSWLRRLRVGFAKPADVLLSHKGSVGFCAVVPKSLPELILSPQVTYYRLNQDALNPQYMKGWFSTSFFQSHLSRAATQSTRAYAGITRQKELPLMLPPKKLQDEYARVAAATARLRQRVLDAKAETATLFGSLSQQAFAGEL